MTLRRIALLLALSLLLIACGGGTERKILTTRWVKADSVLVFTMHWYIWDGSTNRLFTTPRASEIHRSEFRTYLVKVAGDTSGYTLGSRRLVHLVNHAVPCNGLVYDSATSKVMVAYLAVDAAKQGDCPVTGTVPSLRILAGQVIDSHFVSETAPFDTAATLDRLRLPEAYEQSVIVNGMEVCLTTTGPCFFAPR